MSELIWDILDEGLHRREMQPYSSLAHWPTEASIMLYDPVLEKDMPQGACLRAGFFRLVNHRLVALGIDEKKYESAPFDDKTLWKFEIAKKTEAAIINAAKAKGVFSSNNVKIKHRVLKPLLALPISGEIDLILSLPKEDSFSERELIGTEIKSIYGYYGEKQVFNTQTQRRKGFKGEPKIEHVMQTALYAYITAEKIPYFHLLYISRGDATRDEFKTTIEYQEDEKRHYVLIDDERFQDIYIEGIFKRYAKLEEYLMADEIPPRDYELSYSQERIDLLAEKGLLSKTDQAFYDKEKFSKIKKGDWRCSYCKFKQICYTADGTPALDTEEVGKTKEKEEK